MTLHEAVQTLAVIHGADGWRLSRSAAAFPEVFRASIHVGYNSFGLRCVGCRIGHGISMLQGLYDTSTTVLLFWPSATPWAFRSIQYEGAQALRLATVFGSDWAQFRFVQFLTSSPEASPDIKRIMPDEPMLGDTPTPDNQYPQPPTIPIPVPMNVDSDHESEKDDEVRDLPKPPSRSPQPPGNSQRSPAPTDKSSRRPVGTGSSNASTTIAVNPPAIPPPTGQIPWTPVPTERYITVSTDQSNRSRTPYPTGHNQGTKAKSASWQARLLSGPSGPTPKATPKAIPKQYGNHTVGGSSSSTAPAPGIPVPHPPHIPILPFSDPPVPDSSSTDDDVSQASTLELHPDGGDGSDLFPAFFAKRKRQGRQKRQRQFWGKQIPTFQSGIDAAEMEQTAYLAETAQAKGPYAIRSAPANDGYVEVEVSALMSRFIIDAPAVQPDEVLIVYLAKKGSANKQKMMVEKNLDNLTAADVRANWDAVEKGIRAEVKSLHECQTFVRQSRKSAENVLSARWVHKWKVVDGKRVCKSRMTVRGFEDLAGNDVQTFAGTASRWGQRLVVSIAAQRQWSIFCWDVSVAFLQGLTFQELAVMQGTPERNVCFVPPAGSEQYFQELPGMQAYNPLTEVLRMVKAIYGLKDAPRAWKLQLERVLRLAGGQPLHTDRNLWCWFVDSTLAMLLSTHVDDLKGSGQTDVVTKVKHILTREFGALKESYGNFTHCGIEHVTDVVEKTITLHQESYVKQLKLMDTSELAALET